MGHGEIKKNNKEKQQQQQQQQQKNMYLTLMQLWSFSSIEK